jgi:hypothetical protein
MILSPLLFALALQPQATADDAARAAALELPKLDLKDLPAWREHIRPSNSEANYESIPWLTEFAEGLQAASDEGKPLLFWAMNGHPLGTT